MVAFTFGILKVKEITKYHFISFAYGKKLCKCNLVYSPLYIRHDSKLTGDQSTPPFTFASSTLGIQCDFIVSLVDWQINI